MKKIATIALAAALAFGFTGAPTMIAMTPAYAGGYGGDGGTGNGNGNGGEGDGGLSPGAAAAIGSQGADSGVGCDTSVNECGRNYASKNLSDEGFLDDLFGFLGGLIKR